jgi:hypothetical protein
VPHLFKECHRWRKEREALRKVELGQAVWDHRGIEHIFVDRRKTKFILKFLEETEIGNGTSQSEADKRAEEWNEVGGWSYGMNQKGKKKKKKRELKDGYGQGRLKQ